MYQLRIFILGLIIVFAKGSWAQPETVTIKKENKQFSLDISYPQGFNKGQVDSIVQAFILKIRAKQGVFDSDTLTATLPGKNSLTIHYKIAYQNERALSLLFSISTYTKGAAHPNNSVETLNFIDGKQVSLQRVFKPNSAYLTQIASYCRTTLKKMENADEKWINEGTQAVDKNYKKWNFTKKGLAIVFDTYQVAAYVYGPQTIIIPQSALPSLRPEIKKAIWGNS